MKSTSMTMLVLVMSILMVSLRATPATSLPATEVLPIKLSATTETSTVPTATTADANADVDVDAKHESHSTGINKATPTTTRTTSTGEVVTKAPTAASTPQVSELEPESKKPESAVEPAQNNSAERAGECLSIGKYCKLAEECCTKRCHTYLGKCVS